MVKPTLTLYHLTKIDTLQEQVNHLNHIVDSLNTVSSQTTIGIGYFHDVIGGTFTSFVGFVAIIATMAGYISWRVIASRFDRMANEIRNEFQNRMATNEEAFLTLTTNFNEEITRLNTETTLINIDSARAMFYSLSETKNVETSIMWGLAVIEGYNKIDRQDNSKAWLKLLLKKLDQLNKDRLHVSFQDICDKMADLKKELKDESLEKLIEFEQSLFKIIYSESPNK